MLARSLLVAFAVVATASLSAAGCGGSAAHDGKGAGAATSGGSSETGGSTTSGGATTSGGRAATGGSTASGGTITSGGHAATGGTSMSGGQVSTGGQNTADAGGASSDICDLPQVAGPCQAYFESYWYNRSTGQCERFIYGGCGGNENRFQTQKACEDACGVEKPGIDYCDSVSDCRLISAGCCGACEPVAASAFISVNVQHVNDRKCDVACGPCPPPVEGQMTTSRYFIPGCQEHTCTVVDIRETDLVSCQSDSDCMLRYGTGCCPQCQGDVVALNRDSDYTSAFCGSQLLPCAACVPPIPATYSSVCLMGRCSVNEPPCTAAHPCP